MNSYYNSKDEIREMYKRGRDLTKVNCRPPLDTSSGDESGRPKRVAVYCRVSTDGIGQTVSFEIQKKYYIKYVRSQPNWKLVGLYSDEGISATTTKNRVGLQMLIRDAKTGKIDLIVISHGHFDHLPHTSGSPFSCISAIMISEMIKEFSHG